MSTEPLIIERIYDAPVQKVWQAITDVKQMKKWYFDLDTFRPEVGFEFSFTYSSDGIDYIHLCKVLEVIPEKKLSHSWAYKNFPGDSVVTWELATHGSGTRVTLTHTGLESFPTHEKDFDRNSFSQGWTQILGESLKKFVDGVS